MLTNPKWPLVLDRLGRKKIVKVSILHILWDHDALLDKINKSNKLHVLTPQPAHRGGRGGVLRDYTYLKSFDASEGHFTDTYRVYKQNRWIRASDPGNFQKSKRLSFPKVASSADLGHIHCPFVLPTSHKDTTDRGTFSLSAAINQPGSATESESIYDSCPII